MQLIYMYCLLWFQILIFDILMCLKWVQVIYTEKESYRKSFVTTSCKGRKCVGESLVSMNILDIVIWCIFCLLCLILTIIPFDLMKFWLGITVCFIYQYGWIEAKGGILAEKKSISRFERWLGKFFSTFTKSNSDSSIDLNYISYVESTLSLIIFFQICRSNQMK